MFLPYFCLSISLLGVLSNAKLPDGLGFKSYYDATDLKIVSSMWFGEIPGKPGSFLIAGKNGIIHQITPGNAPETSVFGKIDVDEAFEGGLMSMAFHPYFPRTRRTYA